MKVFKRIWDAIFYKEPEPDTRFKISIPFIVSSGTAQWVGKDTPITSIGVDVDFIGFTMRSKDTFMLFCDRQEEIYNAKVAKILREFIHTTDEKKNEYLRQFRFDPKFQDDDLIFTHLKRAYMTDIAKEALSILEEQNNE